MQLLIKLLTILIKRNVPLDFKLKIGKIKIEGYIKKSPKGQKSSTDLAQPVDRKLTINSNLFVTELVG